MVKPIIVNVGRAGAANLDVIQEVEYVKDDVKIPYLLQCLQKTAPPVIIFCERKGDVGKLCELKRFDQRKRMTCLCFYWAFYVTFGSISYFFHIYNYWMFYFYCIPYTQMISTSIYY